MNKTPVVKDDKTTDDPPEQHMIYGEVYAPNRPDAQGEFMTKETIRKMAHDFIRSGRMGQIDVMHNNKVVKGGVCIVESWIAPDDDAVFIPGSWVIGMHVPHEALWAAAKSGELNGFSLEAMVIKEEKEVSLEIPAVVSGSTSVTADHEHKFFVTYDSEGLFKGGKTDKVNDHMHEILAGTHTETTEDHSHRFSSVDGIEIIE